MFALTAGVSDLVLTNGARGGARKLDDGLPDLVNGCNIVVFTLTWSVQHIMTLHYGGQSQHLVCGRIVCNVLLVLYMHQLGHKR